MKALRAAAGLLWLPTLTLLLGWAADWALVLTVIGALCAIPVSAVITTIVSAQFARARAVIAAAEQDVALPTTDPAESGEDTDQ